MSLKYPQLFIGVLISSILLVVALYFNAHRPAYESFPGERGVQYVRASGKCVECHRNETSGIVNHFEGSAHLKKGMNCLDCHAPVDNQKSIQHRGFTLVDRPTSKNCAQCHKTEYDQFVQSRHAGPSWAAVLGSQDFTAKQIQASEALHPGSMVRPPHPLVKMEQPGAAESGCITCHAIGKPNPDGSIGSCTECHSKHNPSVAMARQPQTCGQCHMGPDHSQIEIYTESKHGALFNHLRDTIRFDAPSKHLTTRDFPVPVCSTCHMSGLEGMKVTHNVSDRLSWHLFSDISTKRKNADHNRGEMKEICLKCHVQSHVDRFYEKGDLVVQSTNELIGKAKSLMADLKKNGYLTDKPFDEEIEFLYFDLWHYYGRTAKHGAFMGGADFVQWHGNYELLKEFSKLKELAEQKKKSKRKSP